MKIKIIIKNENGKKKYGSENGNDLSDF